MENCASVFVSIRKVLAETVTIIEADTLMGIYIHQTGLVDCITNMIFMALPHAELIWCFIHLTLITVLYK